jgi:hypothetical protein
MWSHHSEGYIASVDWANQGCMVWDLNKINIRGTNGLNLYNELGSTLPSRISVLIRQDILALASIGRDLICVKDISANVHPDDQPRIPIPPDFPSPDITGILFC